MHRKFAFCEHNINTKKKFHYSEPSASRTSLPKGDSLFLRFFMRAKSGLCPLAMSTFFCFPLPEKHIYL